MRRPASITWFALLPALVGCLGSGARVEPAAAPPHRALLLRASRVFDGRTGVERSFAEVCDELARADAVFLGETHLDRLTHDAELEFLLQLAQRRDGKVALAMEMFERDVQPTLDDYLAGRIDEIRFLTSARPWGNYRTDYRNLVELARRDQFPVIASNVPADLRRKLALGGAEAWSKLADSERALLPEKLIENPPEYWARVDNVTRSHGALGMGGGGGSRLFDGQNLWDNSMGDAVARQLAREPDRLVVHVNGGFHSEYGQGTVWQLLQRRPQTKVATVQIVATSDLADATVDPATRNADYTLFVEARAHSPDDGVAAVALPREVGYRLALPPHALAPLPLLVWLCADGEDAQTALDLWQPIVRREAALLAIEPPFPWIGADGMRHGRWLFPGAAGDGAALATRALERILAVVARSDLAQGLAIDPARIVVAGEGDGATVALYASRYLDEPRFDVLAFRPGAQGELALLPLPLPLSATRAARSLALFADDASLASWSEFCAHDGELRVTTTVAAAPAAASVADGAQVAAIRAALRLAPMAPCSAADAIVDGAPAHAAGQLVARKLSRRARAAGLAAAPDLAVTAAAFADGRRLPLSSGQFGGTTIVVVPASASADELAAWRKLEQPDVLQQRSRFHRLRIASAASDGTEGAAPSPKAVIAKLRAENAQRRDFLIVPAEFCADEATLAALRAGLADLGDEVRLEWKAGLGDALPIAGEGGGEPHGAP